MADGKPPYHTFRPMLAMVMIPSKPPPTLADGPSAEPARRHRWAPGSLRQPPVETAAARWRRSTEDTHSVAFRDFIAQCLVKDPARRPTAQQLLSHPFLETVRPLNTRSWRADGWSLLTLPSTPRRPLGAGGAAAAGPRHHTARARRDPDYRGQRWPAAVGRRGRGRRGAGARRRPLRSPRIPDRRHVSLPW